MGKSWSDAAIRRLVDWKACPRCDFSQLTNGWCPNCGADLTGPQAVTLAAASKSAVEALELREEALEKLPIRLAVAEAATQAAAMDSARSSTPAQPAALVETAVAVRPSSQVSVQSVLAVAGAGLVAIAAIVFTFFNPDLDNPVLRNAIVAVITVVFLGAAWLLAQVKLQFSAEAVGALGMVFVIIDIWAIATNIDIGVRDYGVAAIGTLVLSCVMLLLGSLRRMRTWLWSGLVGIAITPLFVGIAMENDWALAIGFVGIGFAALLTHEIAKALQPRFGSALLADHATATVIQFLVLPVVFAQLLRIESESDVLRVLGTAGILAALALMAALAVRNGASIAWSYIAGFLATVAVAVLPFAIEFDRDEWLVAVVPAAAGAAAVILALASLVGGSRGNPVLDRRALIAGTLTVAVASAVPVTFVALLQLFSAQWSFMPPVWGLVAMFGVTAVTLGSAAIGAIRRIGLLLIVALWFGVLALATFATWTELLDAWRVATSLAIAIALVSVATWVRPVAAAALRVRLPLIVGAHVLVAVAVVMSLVDPLVHIFGGIGVVAAIAALTIVMPQRTRPFYVAVGYAYALGVVAYTLDTQTTLEFGAVLGLTTVLAGLVAIAVTLVKAVPVPYWYAVLTITAVPFLISIFSMIVERDLWIGISTAVGFLLAATIVVVQRPGLTVSLRGLAAAAIVPSLAVVVINLVAVLAEKSASPITLPIVAALVALTLPSTGVIGTALGRLGHDEEHAKAVQLWLEISALATGSIAALLTIVRTASNFGTTFLVLVLIGLGAAATGLFLHRRYAWIVAFISFTGALWSLLALGEIDTVELYLMPPALAGAIIGAVAVGRGRRGLGFYAVGLSVAVAAPLGMLEVFGNPTGPSVQVRTVGLLIGAVLLTVIGGLAPRIPETSRFVGLRRLSVPTLFVAIGAASAGVVQAIRHGWDWDQSALGVGEAVLFPVLMLSVISTLLAAFAGLLLAAENPRLAASRWLFVPAVLFLVLGPIASLRHGWAYPLTMLVLALFVLAVMIVTVVVGRTARTVTLPPVWVTFVLAWFTAVAGWAERDHLRVEAFSIPLGLALLAAGIIAMRPVKEAEPSLTAWPIGYERSWSLLAPGIIVTLLPSALATGTDPETLRAILVIALALTAILIGNLRKLAAPFIIGLIALPIEILIVFAVQIGDKIQATTWWITLATAGAVLLVIAVSSERGSTGNRGVEARMRDLR
jgi:hypothetical protein